MAIISYLLAGAILLIRVYVPVSNTVMGGWPVRLLLFVLWCFVVAVVGGPQFGRFLYTLKTRWLEIVCYAIWIVILAFYYMEQGGEHLLTIFLFNAYIGSIPFYVLGTYYAIDENAGRRMAWAIGIVVGVSCLQAIPEVWRNPELVRMGAILLSDEIRSMGIGNYSDLTGFAITLPFFIVVSLQSKGIIRITGIACCIATVGLLMIATLAGVILLTGMALSGCILYYLLLGGMRLHRVLITSVAIVAGGIVVMYIFPSMYGQDKIGQHYNRLMKLFTFMPDIIAGREADPTSRFGLMLDSLNVFLENPLIGAAMEARGERTSTAGNHSSWLDALANYGLLGGIPYMLFHLLIFRRLWKTWRADRHNALYWGCLLSGFLYFFYSFFNVTTQGTAIALFLYATAASGLPPKGSTSRRSPALGRLPANVQYKKPC